MERRRLGGWPGGVPPPRAQARTPARQPAGTPAFRATNNEQPTTNMYHQSYNPTGSVVLSTLVAALPILVLLYFIAVHPHRDERGVRRLGIAAPFAAFYG